ncbi:MAG: hypothetical protein ACFB16_14450 [Phormidesmis sp.]
MVITQVEREINQTGAIKQVRSHLFDRENPSKLNPQKARISLRLLASRKTAGGYFAPSKI